MEITDLGIKFCKAYVCLSYTEQKEGQAFIFTKYYDFELNGNKQYCPILQFVVKPNADMSVEMATDKMLFKPNQYGIIGFGDQISEKEFLEAFDKYVVNAKNFSL